MAAQTERIVERVVEKPESSKQVSAQAYLHTPQAGATVPLLQSAITGLLIGLAVFAVLMKLRVMDAWFWGLITWIVVQAMTWLMLQTHWWGLTALERLTGMDLNRDGVVGAKVEKQETVKTIRVDLHEVTDGGHLRVTYAQFPIDEPTMGMLATGLLGGMPFAERYWTGEGKPLSLSQFKNIRAEMLARGMLELANVKAPQQGYRLTRAGNAAMREFARRMVESGQNPPAPPEN